MCLTSLLIIHVIAFDSKIHSVFRILVYSLLDENGVRNFTTGGRKPHSKFYCHGVAVAIKYAENRTFVGLRDGKLLIYDRDESM